MLHPSPCRADNSRMGRSWITRLRRRLAADSGFSLIEAVVALSILALVSTSFTYGMNLALRVTRDDRLRQQATHLAERELEIVRNQFQHSDESGQLGVLTAGRVTNDAPLPGGTKGSPLEIDGREFVVERTNSLQLSGNGESPCDGGGSVDYLTINVNVSVSWSDTGQAHSVESRTLLTPVKGVEGDVGYIAAKLTDSQGGGTGNVPVVATGPSGIVHPVHGVRWVRCLHAVHRRDVHPGAGFSRLRELRGLPQRDGDGAPGEGQAQRDPVHLRAVVEPHR